MRAIAISIDEASLAAVDRLASAAARRGGGKKGAKVEELNRAVATALDVA